MAKQIPGDPLTGQLPRTQLVVPQDVYGPVRTRRVPVRDEWPKTADPMGITIRQMKAGRVAAVRTRRGVRTWVIRTINTSWEYRNKGRHFFTGMDRHGRCHAAWVDQVISVDTLQRALNSSKVLKAIGSGSSRPRTGP